VCERSDAVGRRVVSSAQETQAVHALPDDDARTGVRLQLVHHATEALGDRVPTTPQRTTGCVYRHDSPCDMQPWARAVARAQSHDAWQRARLRCDIWAGLPWGRNLYPHTLKITYCLIPAWSGLCSASDRAKLDSFLNRCKRLGFCDNTVPTISDVFSNADDSLFKTILENSCHVLHPYLPKNQYQHYHLRQRLHNKALIPKTTYLSDRDYIMRMLYKNCY